MRDNFVAESPPFRLYHCRLNDFVGLSFNHRTILSLMILFVRRVSVG